MKSRDWLIIGGGVLVAYYFLSKNKQTTTETTPNGGYTPSPITPSILDPNYWSYQSNVTGGLFDWIKGLTASITTQKSTLQDQAQANRYAPNTPAALNDRWNAANYPAYSQIPSATVQSIIKSGNFVSVPVAGTTTTGLYTDIETYMKASGAIPTASATMGSQAKAGAIGSNPVFVAAEQASIAAGTVKLGTPIGSPNRVEVAGVPNSITVSSSGAQYRDSTGNVTINTAAIINESARAAATAKLASGKW